MAIGSPSVPLPGVSEAPVEAIDLALSGGGFRATLFHLGLIACLRDTRFPDGERVLARIRIICSVSGGSILAAHMVSHWDDYCSDNDESFRRRVTQLVSAIRTTDISARVLRGSDSRLLDFKPLDSELLAQEYCELLDLPANGDRWDQTIVSRPALFVLATHLNTGQAGAFCREGFFILPVDDAHRHHAEIGAFAEFARTANITNQSIARAVAASSAFPPAFSPLPLVKDSPHMLTDGGVYDNSGVNYLRYLYRTASERISAFPTPSTSIGDLSRRMVVVSDAGRDFPTELRGEYDTFLALALRVTDAQGGRIAEGDSKAAQIFFETSGVSHALFLSIHDNVHQVGGSLDNHSATVQSLLRTIRTELDSFTAEEAFVLYRHGYRVAHEKMTSLGMTCSPVADAPWTPLDPENIRALSRDRLEFSLGKSHAVKKELKSTLRRLVLKKILRDYRLQVAAAILLAAASVGGVSYASYRAGAPRVETSVTPSGAVEIVEVMRYVNSGWPSQLDRITRALSAWHPEKGNKEKLYPYMLATAPIGSLTREQPHATAVVRVERASPIHGWALYLFLEQHLDGTTRLIALTGDERGFILPSGGKTDRIVGLLVSVDPVDDVKQFVVKNLVLTIDKP